MNRYDTIEEVVEKNIDEIVEVEKFNPFHDARGRFSNKNGFASYSADPNTRAGAMAISRSAAAGHMNTVNVHRAAQATGTTIRQNANWLGQGHQQTRSQTASATLNRRIEPANGLGGASQAGALWQRQNQLQGRHTQVSNKPQKPAQNAQQQPQQKPPQKPAKQPAQQANAQNQNAQNTQTLASRTQGVHLSSGDKLAIVPRNYSGQATTTKKAANAHDQDMVVGKDITKTVNIANSRSREAPIDQIAKAQGWNKSPTVTDDLEVFQKAAKQSGTLLMRTVHGSSQTGQSAMDICKDTMSDGNAPLGGYGGKVYGSGMYMVGARTNNNTGRALSRQINNSQNHSFAYGDTQMMATVHPNAKIASPTKANQLRMDFYNLSNSDQARFGHDYGAYIASKGYDGAQWHNRSDPYVTMYNKSAMIFFSGVATQ